MKEKPWLSAKTAGEAYLAAWIRATENPDDYPDTPEFGYHEALAQAVIEWHESRREKVSERWEVEQYGRRVTGIVFATSKLAHLSARINDRVTVVKVTRYRRAK